MSTTWRTAWLFALAITLGACAAPRDDHALWVACDFDNPPFAFITADGNIAGRDVEMMDRVAQDLGLTLEWKKMPFDELLDVVAAGDVDAACATLGITAERERRVSFSTPYYETRIACLVRAGDGEPRALADLDGKRITAGHGTTSEAALLSVLPRAIPIVVTKAPTPTRERLRLKEIDGAIMDGPDADDLAAAHPDQFRVLEKPLAVERYAIATPKSDGGNAHLPELRQRIDAVLAQLRATGWLQELDRRWGL